MTAVIGMNLGGLLNGLFVVGHCVALTVGRLCFVWRISLV